jgi:mRNA-degrading endonuclease toxin of MazEF toxin-antitoxin module
MAYKAGSVVLVQFTFREQLAERTRPAVVLSASGYNQQQDLIVGAITSPLIHHQALLVIRAGGFEVLLG